MNEIVVKTCTVCDAEKELKEFPVNRNVCTLCRREKSKVKQREYYTKNRELELARKKIYEEKNKDKVAAYQANYRLQNRDKAACQAQYQAEEKQGKEESATA